jgi:hypothetical protein
MRYELPVQFAFGMVLALYYYGSFKRFCAPIVQMVFGLEKVAYEKQIHIEFSNFRAGTSGRTFDELGGTNH